MSLSKNRREYISGILTIMLSIEGVILFTLVTLFVIRMYIDANYRDQQSLLVDSYYATEDSIIFVDTPTTEKEIAEISIGGRPKSGIDSILRYKPLDIELPVCIGNFEKNIADFNLTVFDDTAVLGKTTYSVMGHHAIALHSAFGWLKELQEGDIITLESKGITYTYRVSEIFIGYPEDMVYLFSLHNENVVYLATCDYTLGNTERTVYRAIKCLPI